MVTSRIRSEKNFIDFISEEFDYIDYTEYITTPIRLREELYELHQYYLEFYTRAIKLAVRAQATQIYGNFPYTKHLEDVEQVLIDSELIDDHRIWSHVFLRVDNIQTLASSIRYRILAYLHDTLEDSSISYNDLVNKFGRSIANDVYVMTEYRGTNRRARKPDIYYIDISKRPFAMNVKIADRIANVKFSLLTDSKMMDMYKTEQEKFRLVVPEGTQSELMDQLESLLA